MEADLKIAFFTDDDLGFRYTQRPTARQIAWLPRESVSSA
jgi:hypothetical protein